MREIQEWQWAPPTELAFELRFLPFLTKCVWIHLYRYFCSYIYCRACKYYLNALKYHFQYYGTTFSTQVPGDGAMLGSFVGPAAQHESDNQGIVNLNPPPCTPPPSTQKSPNHPKPFKSPPPPFWVSLFPFHSFSASHHHLYMVKRWLKYIVFKMLKHNVNSKGSDHKQTRYWA